MSGPDFLGIGAQRAGSTWLHKLLSRHPEVWVTPVKELHYFDDPANKRWRYHLGKRFRQRDFPSLWDARYFLGRASDRWYASLFARAQTKGLISGEITPAYAILDDDGFARIKAINPRTKFIFTMRDPIDRTWSMYRNKLIKLDQPPREPSVDEMLKFCRHEGTWKRSDYFSTIERLERFFPAEQVHYGFFEDLVERPMEYAAGVLDFLGVSTTPLADILRTEPVNAAARGSKVPPEFANAVATQLLPSFEQLCTRFSGQPEIWLSRLKAVVPG